MKKKTVCLILALLLTAGSFTITAFAAYENTYINTGNQSEDIIGVALTQYGYMEGSLEGTVAGSDNYTKYGVWWTNETNWGVDYSHSAWCSMFVSWCACQANIPASVLYRTAGCDEGVKKAKERGTWHFSPSNGGNYTPKRGDIIYFGTVSDSDHVGIVTSVSNGKVYTIEGNSSNKVNKVSYSLTSSGILGYSSPEYTNTQQGEPQPFKLAGRLEPDSKLYADVSKWQGSVDWQAAANGIDGVIIRIGYRATSSRSLIIDPYFLSNYNQAKAAGIPVGCYFYSTALNSSEAVQEADWIIEKLHSYSCTMELPVFIDMEDSSAQSLSKNVLTGIARAFCDELLAESFLPGIYVSKYWATDKINMSELEDCAVWIAQYNTSCTYTGHYDMWQYTDKGSVAGISGDVDLNHCYVNYIKYIKENGLNGFEKSGSEPANAFPSDETYIITNPGGANVFSSSDPGSAVIGIPDYDQQVYLYENDGVFGRIIFGAEEGRISLADVTLLSNTYTLGESLGTYRTTATELNIRSGPSTSYASLGTLPQGTEVEITALSGIWCRFSYNGADAWLSSNYLEYISKTVLDSNKGTGKNTIVRSGAGDRFNIPSCPFSREGYSFAGWALTRNGAAVYSDEAELTAENSVRVLYAVWNKNAQQNLDDGRTYIVKASPSLNVRTGAGTEYDKIGSLANGTQIFVYESSGGWGRILYNGDDAWISLSYASAVENEIVFDEGCGYFRVTASSLNVRSGAGTGYTSLGTLSSGDIIKATERSGIWVKTVFGGKEGWVSSNYLAPLNIIQFDSNKGAGDNMYLTAQAGETVTLPANGFIREDYIFKGWSREKNGPAEIEDGAQLSVQGNEILYAVWESDIITILPAPDSPAVVNENNFTVSGVPQGLSAQQLLNDYIECGENITLALSSQKAGTGSVITASRQDGKTKQYTVVVSGDIDGDSFSDARDAILAQAYLCGYLAFIDLPAGAVWAIDTDNDMQITENDYQSMLSGGLNPLNRNRKF